MKHYWRSWKYLLLLFSGFKLDFKGFIEAVSDNRSHLGFFKFGGVLTVDQLEYLLTNLLETAFYHFYSIFNILWDYFYWNLLNIVKYIHGFIHGFTRNYTWNYTQIYTRKYFLYMKYFLYYLYFLYYCDVDLNCDMYCDMWYGTINTGNLQHWWVFYARNITLIIMVMQMTLKITIVLVQTFQEMKSIVSLC